VTSEAAAETRLQPTYVEVDVVVHDEQLLRQNLEEAGRSGDRSSRLVHVGLGLDQRDAALADACLSEASAELRAKAGLTVSRRKLVHDHPTDVVTVAFVFAPRIPEAGDEQIERRG
jgi:hypothetical protein